MARERNRLLQVEQQQLQQQDKTSRLLLPLCVPTTTTTMERMANTSAVVGAAIRNWPKQDCDQNLIRYNQGKLCDFKQNSKALSKFFSLTSSLTLLLLITISITISDSVSQFNHNHNSTIIINQQSHLNAQLLPASTSGGNIQNLNQQQQQHTLLIGPHLQPSFVYGVKNRTMNFTHIAVDELTGSIYVGATNWLFQLSASNLKAEFALKTGPAMDNSRDCAPADCLAHIAHIDVQTLPMQHGHGSDFQSLTAISSGSGSASRFNDLQHRHRPLGATMHTMQQQQSSNSSSATSQTSSYAFLTAPRSSNSRGQSSSASSSSASSSAQQQQQQLHNNNYNKILAIDVVSRQLIVCGSLNQGACRKHQLGHLANYTDLIPLPVASNDEYSSSVALITSGTSSSGPTTATSSKPKPIIYVAATNSRLGPYREMVPAISARYLEPASRAMQIIERSFTDSARIDISFELRDYYLVNYVYTFQYNDYIYFATVQRKSPLRQLEEWGYITRLARMCLSDLSFQSYTEISLECKSNSNSPLAKTSSPHTPTQVNYNLLQDAYLTPASSHLAQQLGIRAQSGVLVGAFAQSKDHTTKSQQKSAICLYPMERIEQKFNENIHMCYNGTSKARNMNYIAGSVNDCPKVGKAGNIANFCNEPIKLNGSIPLLANPVISYENELLTSIVSTLAPTSPINLNLNSNQNSINQQAKLFSLTNQQRQHQVLIAGTNTGTLKRIALITSSSNNNLENQITTLNSQPVRGVEFDSIQVDEQQQEPILADLHLIPTNNPQLIVEQTNANANSNQQQSVIVATPYKIAKLRINSCKVPSLSKAIAQNSSSTTKQILNSPLDECNLCASTLDPFCGWCSSSSSCTTRDECLNSNQNSIHWSPFDQIKCADYQPIAPQFVPIQSTSHQPIDVNIRIAQQQPNKQQPTGDTTATATITSQQQAIALQLAQTQFTCHFDYLTYSNRSMPAPRLSGATTKATQARLNLHTSTIVIACPLPPHSQRPQITSLGFVKIKLTVRLVPNHHLNGIAETNMQQLLGMKLMRSSNSRYGTTTATTIQQHQQLQNGNEVEEIERELIMYDCSIHSTCRTCLNPTSSSNSMMVLPNWVCSWCPLSNKCTFNSSHPDLGCAASAIISTTPNSALAAIASSTSNSLRPSHLTGSLDQAQANVLGLSINRLAQCPIELATADESASIATSESSIFQESGISQTDSSLTLVQQHSRGQQSSSGQQTNEILVAHNSRRSIQVALSKGGFSQASNNKQRIGLKWECLLEIEGAKARISGRFIESSQVVVCQENLFTYQEETSTYRAQLYVILNDNQVIETTNVIIYKCHLFGVNPPALTSTIGGGIAQHSSVAWQAHELFNELTTTNLATSPFNQQFKRQLPASSQASDCSLCLNVERKYQCAWCNNQCRHSDQCQELAASTCPPPRIDSIHPTSGPLEGGTLVTIEGSNLGSNEREIQDKISIGGEPCQLVMYSVSTRIVCKTGPSLHGPQAATVFVGNRAGVTSAYEKFHYKAVHLTDVTPRIGPVSGGTRLYLTGSNLNIGSRVHVFLDDIPCAIDGNDSTSNSQITCITAPNLLASSTRITKLTLMIDNSTHHLPYPFTYQPDPIITSIVPAESFISGGRLILITGQHLASPQSTKLMVYHENRHNIVNATTCRTENDTYITCLSPAISRELLNLSPNQDSDHSFIGNKQQQQQDILSYENGGLKLKMSLFMDDVRSVRNLDEYYHHLPQYLTYYEDPQLFRLQSAIVEFSDQLTIQGEHLQMKQLDQDIYITIGSHVCSIRSVTANQVVCEPPQKVAPVTDENGRLIDRPILPIVAEIGSNLRFQIGHMQYSSRQYELLKISEIGGGSSSSSIGGMASSFEPSNSSGDIFSSSFILILCYTIMAILSLGLVYIFLFVLSRFKQSKAEREYKRIQLQMGSLDINGQPIGGPFLDGSLQGTSRLRTLDYVGGAFGGKRLLYQLNRQLPTFPPTSITDNSSLAANQHLVKLSSNGTIINSANQQYYNNTRNSNSSQSSPGSSGRDSTAQLFSSGSGQTISNGLLNHQRLHHNQTLLHAGNSDKGNLLFTSNNNNNGSARNFSWTQEAPSTIVPYAVIEACNLSLEGKNAIKEYV